MLSPSPRIGLTLKVLVILCLIVSVTMVIDLFLPHESIAVQVEKVINSKEVIFGNYYERLKVDAWEELRDGEGVNIKVSRIYHEIRAIEQPEQGKVLKYPTTDNYYFLLLIIVFAAPLLLYNNRMKANSNIYVLVKAAVVILGFISILIIGKLLLVHVFDVIKIM
jgi:hypothetical protein